MGSSPDRPTLLRPEAVAELLGVSTKTLAQWRWAGKGPSYYKPAGRSILYDENAVFSFISSTLTQIKEIP